ncbi:reverse transcriptase domain-containing protein [Tanacetum coccineum]
MVFETEAQPSSITQAAEERNRVAFYPEYPEQTIAIGSTLTEEEWKALCELLKRNLDIFSWIPEDMTGVPRHLAEHRLNVLEGCLPVRQNKRSQEPERNKAIQKEIAKLVDAEIMKEVHYHSWLSNPVMVKKHDDSWRIYPFKCFLDAYKGYHQIKMAKEDEEKMAFIISQGIFYYSKMPIGLKNVGATYQRLVDKAFQKQIDRNLEDSTRDKHEAESQKMHLRGGRRHVLAIQAKAEAAFKQMKMLIAELPTLTAPMEKEELIVYLATAREAVSAVLMTEREAKQMPVYFVNCALQDGFGAGLILTNPKGTEFTYALRFSFDVTNNEAEYEAFISGFRIAEQMGMKNLQANVDSRLVANQVNGSYIAKESGMIQYLEKVKTLASSFRKFPIKQVPKSENKKAYALSKITSTSFAHLTKLVLVEELSKKSINETEVLAVVEKE